jgi:surface polysaccharide O-acyltransferase-like enzyme
MQDQAVKPAPSRQMWADFVRSIGILLVILGHVSGINVSRFQTVSEMDWIAGNIYNVIARSCVPLLFMVSGALLLPRQESLKDFLTKRFNKVVYPFLFWSVMYLLWKEGCFSFGGSFEQWREGCYGSYSIFNISKTLLFFIITNPAEYHLWFMYELFGVYMFTPILRVFAATDENRKYLWYLLAIWFIFGPIKRLIELRLQTPVIMDLGYLTGYIGYFILGYLISRIRLTKPIVAGAAVVYIAMAFYTGNITYQFTSMEGKLVDYFQYLLGWNIILLATSFFILLKALGEYIFSKPHPTFGRIVLHLSAASFGMYLIHVFIIALLKSFHISPVDGPSIYMIPITTFGVFFISWAIIAVLQKIPYVRSLIA